VEEMFCAKTRLFLNGECIPLVQPMQEFGLVLHVRLVPVNDLSCLVFGSLATGLEDTVISNVRHLGCVSESVTELFLRKSVRGDVTFDSIANNTIHSIRYEFVIFITAVDIDMLYSHITKLLSNQIIQVVDSDFNTFDFVAHIEDKLSQQETCIKNTWADSIWNDLIGESTTIHQLLSFYVSENGETVSVYQTKRNSCHFRYDIVYPCFNFLHFLNCPLVSISKEEYNWSVLKDGKLQLNDLLVFKTDEFYYTSTESIALCEASLSSHINTLKRSGEMSPETVVSVVCICVSIVCLLLSFIAYVTIQNLRKSLPGKNILALITALLCAQVLYLIGDIGGLQANHYPCQIVGMLTHFAWLSSLFWMNVCTFHLFKVLGKVKVMNVSSRWKRFLAYNVYAIAMPLMMVSINIAFSFNTDGTVGYGKVSCYIDTQEMIIYTFAVPVGIVIILNLVLFLVVIVKIGNAPSVTKNVQNERNELAIFVKLSTVTGFTWIFGLLYVMTDNVVLSYMFIILNASQGVFLFFAFIANKRVLSMVCEKLFGQTRSLSSNLSTISSRGQT